MHDFVSLWQKLGWGVKSSLPAWKPEGSKAAQGSHAKKHEAELQPSPGQGALLVRTDGRPNVRKEKKSPISSYKVRGLMSFV